MSATLTRVDVPSPPAQPRADHVVARLVAGSSLMLFLELALIRWLGAEVVHLSYFSNFVLLGSFLGIGLGFLVSKRVVDLMPSSCVLLALLVVGALLFPSSINRTGSSLIYFTSLATSGPPSWLVLPLIFIAVAAILAGPAQLVGRCFGELEPLTAYRWDLIGSLLGIAMFTVLSFLRAPSVAWGSVVCLAFLCLVRPARRLLVGVFGAVIVSMLVLESTVPGVSWSPYYKITTATFHDHGYKLLDISVNGIPHQLMAPAAWKLKYGEQQYAMPYIRTPGNSLDNVLIVGAGSGSDVGIALAKGAKHIDAVDIDPRILQIGEQRNPDHAYASPRVSVHTNDGRAFLESTDTKYDLILFALPDSLALVNGASQIRLESFLFTAQALSAARSHLEPGGAFAMYNYYRQTWLIDRLAGTAATVFGHEPCVDRFHSSQAVVTVGLTAADQTCGSAYHPSGPVVRPATDDRPFLYYEGGGIPAMYLLTLGGILLLSLVLVRAFGGPFRRMRPYADLFMMGAAFLLLETKNVATFALLFGTTWLVNAFVFGGVLLVVLAAVETTRRFRTPRLGVLLPVVVATLGISYVVQPDALLTLPYLPRLAVAVALAFLPIYIANVAFSKRFAASADSQEAFAVNLLGAIVGGCLEYGALVTGYRNLLIVVAVIYLLAFALQPRGRRLA